MSYEHTPLNALVAEQEKVQQAKFQERLLEEYDSYIFPSEVIGYQFRSSAVADFLVEKAGAGDYTLPGLLHGMSENKMPGQKVHWVDVGSGKGYAMRQVANLAYAQNYIDMTSVDLLDPQHTKEDKATLDYLEQLSPGILKDQTRPRFIQADAQDVVLPKAADLITSIEMVQYLNNPLKCIANWYNQLADGGLMIVLAERDWASWIRYADSWKSHQEASPTEDLVGELSRSGIEFAITKAIDKSAADPGEFKQLAIQKRPGTELIVHAPVTEIWTNTEDYKAVYYNASAGPLVEVIDSGSSINQVPSKTRLLIRR